MLYSALKRLMDVQARW